MAQLLYYLVLPEPVKYGEFNPRRPRRVSEPVN